MAKFGRRAYKLPTEALKYEFEHLLRDYFHVLLTDVSRSVTEETTNGYKEATADNMGNFARLSEQDRAHNQKVQADKRRAATQLLETVSNHGFLTSGKNNGHSTYLKAV